MRGASVVVAVLAILLGTGLSPSVARTAAQVPATLAPGNVLFGYEAAAAAARIITYDLSQTPAIPIAACVPTPSVNGRGLAFDPSDGNLWYTFVSSTPVFTGDGLIHKTTPTCGAVTPAATIMVSGALQSDFGALDMDPTDSSFIWVAGYQPVANTATVSGNCAATSTTCSYYYKVRKSDGVVVQTCKTEFQGGGFGNDSLTVGNFGSGLKLLTDAGEIATTPNNLLVVDPVSCATESMIPKSVGMTGIDFEMSSLFATDSKVLYQLGGAPFSTVTPLGLTGTPFELEDISLGTIPATTAVPGKTTGGGVISDGRANFGHIAKTTSTSGNLARGNLEFNDKLTQDNVHGNVDHASFAPLPGSAKRGGTAEFSGSCTVKTPTNPSGSPCAGSFFVLVTDQDEPGAGKDTFTILYCKTPSTCQLRGDGAISKGNIQVTLGTP